MGLDDLKRFNISYISTSARLELIPPDEAYSHTNPSSPLLSFTRRPIFLLHSEKLHVLYHVTPSLLLSSSNAASVDLCRHNNSFHGVIVLSPHHMTVGPTISNWAFVFCQWA